MRASVRRERTIAVPAERAWEILGRPELIHLWFPGIDSCEMDGTIRTITTSAGLPIPEEILTVDDLQRRFQYRVAGGFFKEHLGTIDVIALDAERCLVVYSSDADPATMAIVLGGATEAALEEVGRQLESGKGPAIDAVAEATSTAAAGTGMEA